MTSGAARADSSAPVRLLVLETMAELGARVRGQTSDLALTIEVEASPATSGEVQAAVAAARHTADVVAWLDEAPREGTAGTSGGTAVFVWIAGHERVYSRRVGPRLLAAAVEQVADSEQRSATLETAALVVRSAVRSVLFERASGARASVTAALLPNEPPSTPGPEPRGATEPPLETGRERAVAATSGAARGDGVLRFAPRAGVDWSYSGLSPRGRWSANAGLALQLGRLGVGIAGSWSLPESMQYQAVELTLQRRTLVAEMAWEWLAFSPLSLQPTLGVGASWVARTSRALSATRTATPSRVAASALISAGLVASGQLTRELTLSAHAGVHWQSDTPRYAIQAPPNLQIDAVTAWRWQPNGGIALGALF